MPVMPIYPGVYIEEIPRGVCTIMGVATSITDFIGCDLHGAMDKPATICSFADFERFVRTFNFWARSGGLGCR